MVRQEAEGRPGSPRQIRKENSQARAATIAANKAAEQAILAYHRTLGISVMNEVVEVEVERHVTDETKVVSLHLTRNEVALAPEGMQQVLADLGIGRRDNLSVVVRLSEKLDPVSQLAAFSLTLQPYEVTGSKPGITFGAGDENTLDPKARAAILSAGNRWLQQVFDGRRQLVTEGLVNGAGK